MVLDVGALVLPAASRTVSVTVWFPAANVCDGFCALDENAPDHVHPVTPMLSVL
jgi:hypothetical protein